MPPRRALILTLFAILLSGAGALAEPLGAGDEKGAWLVAPGTRGCVLYFLPAGAPDPRAEPATEPLAQAVAALPIQPIAIACDADAAFLLFPRRVSDTPGVSVNPGRLITRAGDSPHPEFSRADILAPLPEGGEILQVALAGTTPLVLRRSVEPNGPAFTLLALRANTWLAINLPKDLDHASPTWLCAIAERPILAQRRDPTSLRLWTLASLDADAPIEWTSQSVPSDDPIDEVLPSPTGVRAIARTPGALEVLSIQAGRLSPTFAIELDKPDPVLAPWGAGLALAWPNPDLDSGLDALLISSDGKTRYQGPLLVAGPVSPTELQVLAVMLGSVFFTAVVFMLRPGTRSGAAIRFPPGAALASPARRLVAFVIDLLPGALVAYVAWFADAPSLAAVGTMLTEHGAAPILAVAAITIVHSTIGEATLGRTLGKALTRCRTISYSGQRPSWGQAFGRNVVRVLCPPIGLLIVLAPASPHPGSFDTLVIVEHAPDAGAEAGSSAPPPSPPRPPRPPQGPPDRS